LCVQFYLHITFDYFILPAWQLVLALFSQHKSDADYLIGSEVKH